MDYVLNILDYLAFDHVYNEILPKVGLPLLETDNIYRQSTSLLFITVVFGFLVYFLTAGFSYHFIFDKRLMKHPRFLPNQIQLEITCAAQNIIPMSILTVPFFVAEVRGFSLLYDDVDKFGIPYLLFSIAAFLLFTDFGVYVIHRGLHHKSVYASVHKLHHKWLVPSPFASHAFYFLDGYAQSLPYHIAIFIFPIHKLLYLGLFGFVNIWTVLIHDGEYFDDGTIINSAANHTIHHLYFNFNYGQYFTLWDRVFGSYRACPPELLDREKRHEHKQTQKTAKDVDQMIETMETKKSN